MREVARFSHGLCFKDKPNFVDKVPMPAVVEASLDETLYFLTRAILKQK